MTAQARVPAAVPPQHGLEPRVRLGEPGVELLTNRRGELGLWIVEPVVLLLELQAGEGGQTYPVEDVPVGPLRCVEQVLDRITTICSLGKVSNHPWSWLAYSRRWK